MIQSMTGYGKAEAQLTSGKLTLEIRTLNGKNADINIKTVLLPKDKELEVRKTLADRLVRGTIDLYINFEASADDASHAVNAGIFQSYWKSASAAMEPFGISREGIAAAILRLPDVVESRKSDVIAEEEWPLVADALNRALDALCTYRAHEGEALYKDVTDRVAQILSLYDEVESLEYERIDLVREKLNKALADLAVKPNPERFEQELIFYLEKYDINEEKVRLRQHCKYFREVIDNEPYPGKKLGFIIQEMGREINTTGSKANHPRIQQLVVRMKDQLEKIREQSLNIL